MVGAKPVVQEKSFQILDFETIHRSQLQAQK